MSPQTPTPEPYDLFPSTPSQKYSLHFRRVPSSSKTLTVNTKIPSTSSLKFSCVSAGFPPAATLIAEGEGGGLAKLAGLLSCGIDSVIHPCAVAIHNLIEASEVWSRLLLDTGVLPPLLLLNETAGEGKQVKLFSIRDCGFLVMGSSPLFCCSARQKSR